MSVRQFKERFLKKLSPTSPSFGSNVFMQELALRSRNSFRSDRRLIRDLPDGLALIVMTVQFLLCAGLVAYSLASPWSPALSEDRFVGLLGSGAVAFLSSTALTLFSCVLLYHFTSFLLHAVSLAVLAFLLSTVALAGFEGEFGVSALAGLLTFTFLALYYWRGARFSKLSCMFISSAGRICWRNLGHLGVVYAVYIPIVFSIAFFWCAGVWSLQLAPWPNWARWGALGWCFVSLMCTGAFLRDFLQIWLSRVIYLNTFRHGGERATIVTSLTRRASTAGLVEEADDDDDDHDEKDELAEIRRQITRESTWWCFGTASRSAFHLVLRGVSVHLWILALIQVWAPEFGPPANPTCVLDVFHVPTAIYGTSFTKSRKFVGETMLNHGMDRISVDVYIRTFIYYMFTYGNGILALLALQRPLHFAFRADFIAASTLSIFFNAAVEHFIVIFVAVAAILVVTSVDSVHMILCWAICETPTAVSHLEPQLMATLVSKYHARLDLKRFTGDRIEINNELTQHDLSV
jgi:hypothetical protein